MSRSNFASKFRSDLKLLTSAVEGEVALDEDKPRLYQKLIRYYEDRGIDPAAFFYDDHPASERWELKVREAVERNPKAFGFRNSTRISQ